MNGLNKKAQGLPMNVVILGIIVIVVLIVVLIFFVGGTAQITSKIKDIFTGRVSAQSAQLAVEDCKQFCASAIELPNDNLKGTSTYCTKAMIVDNAGTATKYKCGSGSRNGIEQPTESEAGRGIKAGGDLGITCDITCPVPV